MPIKQMVLYRWKPDVPAERREHHLTQVRAFAGKVEGIIEVLDGPRVHSWPEEWDHGLILTWSSRAAREAWDKHPEHDRTAPGLVADTQRILSFDFEC
jgi:hypothetical protein